MVKLGGFCRIATTFAKSGGLDEEAFGQYVQRFVDAGIGVYLGSAGSGEGNALTTAELRRVYEIGVDVCKGRVPAHGNPPEAQTVKQTRENTMLAVEAGVEIVNIYGPTGWHEFKPRDDEFIGFFDDLLPDIKHPVALAPNPTMGYTPKPQWIAHICNKYSQVVAVNLVGLSDDYLIQLQDLVKRKVDYNVPIGGATNMLALGAVGVIGGEFNILPKTLRRFIDLYEARELEEQARVYADLKRFKQFVAPWSSATPRWIKMAMKVLKLPGGEGGLREPYRMPPAAELEKFTAGLLELGIPELDDLAKKAALK